MLSPEVIKVLSEKNELIQKANSMQYSRNHLYKVSNALPGIINKFMSCTSTKEMTKPLIRSIKILYGELNIAMFNDNKELVSSSTDNNSNIELLGSKVNFDSLLNNNPYVQTLENVPNETEDCVYYKAIVKYNNIVYYYIILELNKSFSKYEIETLTNLLYIFSSIHTNKIMLEYLSKLVITSADAINHDPKTKTYSVRSLQNDYAKLEKQPYTYVFMDLDKFKSINDTYGHDVGDIVLIRFAEYLIECANKLKGKAYRFGGEEFIIIAPGDINSIYNIVDATRVAFSKEQFKYGDTTFNVTVSSGMYRSKTGEKAEECIKKADNLLYKAKSTGRNKICYE